MTTAGIICELNPFHCGHEHIIRSARSAGADRVVLVMSGDYVQRGYPAAFPRRMRAECALLCGADAVLSIPTGWATSSAEAFASAGVGILDSLGFVDMLVFGSESGETERLAECARILAEEPESYRQTLREFLRSGMSFPGARAASLPRFLDLLKSPNDILAVEYMKALIRRGSMIRPCAVRREGGPYSDEGLEGGMLSAAAIRRAIRENRTDVIRRSVPEETLSLLDNEISHAGMADADEFSVLLADRLFSAKTPEDFLVYADVTETLAMTFFRKRPEFVSFSGFAKICASRSVTLTHVNRALLHILLGIKKREGPDQALWTQLLGFRETSSDLVGEMRKSCCLPVVINPPRDRDYVSKPVRNLLEEELRVSDLYRAVRSGRTGNACGAEIAEPVIKV